MSREAEIAKIDEELEKLGKEVEKDEVEEIEEDETEDDGTEDTEEAPEKEPEKEEVKEEKPEEKSEERPKLEIKTDLPDSTLGFKLREAARETERLRRENEELKKPKAPSREEDFEGNITHEIQATKQELEELKAWKAAKELKEQEEAVRDGAFSELHSYESEAADKIEDYTLASNYVKSMIAASIKTDPLKRGISNKQLAEETATRYAQFAGIALSESKHPGQAIYEMAHEWGYKKQEPERPKLEVKQDNKIPLAKLAENKKKSSGMHGTGGNGSAFPNMAAVAEMSNAERMRLSESDWARLEAEG